jgi:hypothetical protein
MSSRCAVLINSAPSLHPVQWSYHLAEIPDLTPLSTPRSVLDRPLPSLSFQSLPTVQILNSFVLTFIRIAPGVPPLWSYHSVFPPDSFFPQRTTVPSSNPQPRFLLRELCALCVKKTLFTPLASTAALSGSNRLGAMHCRLCTRPRTTYFPLPGRPKACLGILLSSIGHGTLATGHVATFPPSLSTFNRRLSTSASWKLAPGNSPQLHRSRIADHPSCPCNSFRMNTSKSASKQRTLTSFRMNTYKKLGEGAAR